MIVDASVLLSAFFPDEAQPQAQALLREHVARRITLKAPDLLPYEFANAVWQAERRGRISGEQADQILQSIRGLEIELAPVRWEESLPLARQFGRSIYDAAYLTLAQAKNEALITGDQHLYNAVKDGLDFVIFIGDYQA
jgi:predicted nucleic acid-binding protein